MFLTFSQLMVDVFVSGVGLPSENGVPRVYRPLAHKLRLLLNVRLIRTMSAGGGGRGGAAVFDSRGGLRYNHTNLKICMMFF